VTTLNGIGFSPGLQVTVAGNNGSTLSASASHIQVAVPSGTPDGTATIQVTDPVSGAFSQMIGALTYGASATDLLLLLQGAEPATPVGSQAANAIRVRAVAADGVTPVSGATIAWTTTATATNGLQFSACSGASSCSVLSDEAGESSSLVTPTATGQSTITIALAPASYSPPQSQQATVVGTSTVFDLAAVAPTQWVGQGATISVPLTVEALDLGVPMANVSVNFAIARGTASLSAGSATTNVSGFATITANLTSLSANVQVSACVAPNNAPCQTFTLFSTPTSLWTLETVSGSSQVLLTGQSFQPLVMRVTDGSAAANPVMGVNVTFETTLARVSPDQGGQQDGDPVVGGDGMPVLLGSSQAQVVSTQDGLASIVPSAGNVGPCDVFITVSAGQSTTQLQMESLAAIVTGPTNSPAKAPSARPDPYFVPNFAPNFGSQTSAPQSVPEMLFAVPQGIASNDPVVDSHVSDCPEPCAVDISGDRGDPKSSNPAGSEKSASPPAALPPADATTSKKPAPPVGSDVAPIAPRSTDASGPINAPGPMETQSPPASSNSLPEDKRGCRVLAGDGPIF